MKKTFVPFRPAGRASADPPRRKRTAKAIAFTFAASCLVFAATPQRSPLGQLRAYASAAQPSSKAAVAPRIILSPWMSKADRAEIVAKCRALGPAAVDPVAGYLDDSSKAVRVLAARCLASTHRPEAFDRLARKLATENDPRVRVRMFRHLSDGPNSCYAPGGEIHQRAEQALGDRLAEIRRQALSIIAKADATTAREIALHMIKDPDAQVRSYAHNILWKHVDPLGYDWIRQAVIADSSPLNRSMLVSRLVNSGTAQGEALVKQLVANEPAVAESLQILRDLAFIPSDRVRSFLQEIAETGGTRELREEAKKLWQDSTAESGKRPDITILGVWPGFVAGEGGTEPEAAAKGKQETEADRFVVLLGNKTVQDLAAVDRLCRDLRKSEMSDEKKVERLIQLVHIASPADAVVQRTLAWLVDNAGKDVAVKALGAFAEVAPTLYGDRPEWLVSEVRATILQACRSQHRGVREAALLAASRSRLVESVPIMNEIGARPDDPQNVAAIFLLNEWRPDPRIDEILAEILRTAETESSLVAAASGAIQMSPARGMDLGAHSPVVSALVMHMRKAEDVFLKWNIITAIQILAGRDFCYVAYRPGISRSELYTVAQENILEWFEGTRESR